MTTKSTGEYSELAVILKASSLGLHSSIPFGDSLPYDLVLDNGKKLLKVQVKTAYLSSKTKAERFVVKIKRSYLTKGGSVNYSYGIGSFDFLIAYIKKYDLFYIFPYEEATRFKTSVVLDPSILTTYRDNWQVLC